MRKGQIKNVNYLRDTRKTLRKNLTPAEAAMWNLLKNKQLDGRKFRRQVSTLSGNCEERSNPYDITQIASPAYLRGRNDLIFHPVVAENDQYRDERLQDLGYRVLRFENEDVFNLSEWVLGEIKKSFK